MQISCIGHEEELFSISCHDRRIQNMASDLRVLLADPVGTERLAEGEAERLHALIPAVEEAVYQLLNGPVPQTLMHGDFHDGNIAATEAGYVIFDWTDACVSHPFFDLLTITDVGDEPLTQEKKDLYTSGYLDEWAAHGFGPPEAIRETSDLTVRIAPLYHAISYWGINRRSEQASLVELGNALPHFLRMFMERMEG
jgi:hypothetical protein